MVKKIAVIVATATTLFITGCSSYPGSAEGVASAVCDEFKAGNLEGAEVYMSDAALEQSVKNESVISKFFALPEFKEEAARLDCSKPTKTQVLADDQKIIHFKGFNVEVKKIDGDWKLVG